MNRIILLAILGLVIALHIRLPHVLDNYRFQIIENDGGTSGEQNTEE